MTVTHFVVHCCDGCTSFFQLLLIAFYQDKRSHCFVYLNKFLLQTDEKGIDLSGIYSVSLPFIRHCLCVLVLGHRRQAS